MGRLQELEPTESQKETVHRERTLESCKDLQRVHLSLQLSVLECEESTYPEE